VLILAAGAMGTAPIMLRSQRRGALGSASTHIGKHLGSNGDHVGGVELHPKRLRKVLGLPGYGQFHKGRPITTMSYDWWVGKRGNRHDGTRFTLQEIFLSQLTNFLYDDGRGRSGDGPSWWGREKKRSISTWSNHIEILAMVEDTHDGEFIGIAPSGGHVQPNGGPIGVGDFTYSFSEQSRRVRDMADDAIRSVVERRGLGRYLPMTESQGAYVAHPLGGCRMADDVGHGVVDDRCEVFGAEGLFCMDSSAIPTSLGVNPSLTIAAVCERAASALVRRAGDFGLPQRPRGQRPQRPPQRIGPRVKPARRG
jgi:hypothetical protein